MYSLSSVHLGVYGEMRGEVGEAEGCEPHLRSGLSLCPPQLLQPCDHCQELSLERTSLLSYLNNNLTPLIFTIEAELLKSFYLAVAVTAVFHFIYCKYNIALLNSTASCALLGLNPPFQTTRKYSIKREKHISSTVIRLFYSDLPYVRCRSRDR